jgi:hypothetical protein
MQPAPEAPPPIDSRSSPAADFLAARLELARLEAGIVARQAARRGIMAGALGLVLAFAWMLLLAGGFGYAANCGMPWHWIAIAVGLLHLMVAIVLGSVLARPAPPAFPHTRAEFEKDCAWLRNLKQNLKSND